MVTDIFWILEKEKEVCDSQVDCSNCPLSFGNKCIRLTSETVPINKYYIEMLVEKLNN